MSQEGRFREDLFYRLGVIHVTLPPLRERRDEIPLLIDYFSDEAAERLQRAPWKMSSRLRTFLTNYSYPGNIRELRNVVFRIACLADSVGDLEHLPANIRPKSAADKAAHGDTGEMTLGEAKKAASDQAEKLFLEKGLQEVGGRVAELARRIDMNRSHLQTLLKKHEIRSKDFRRETAKPA